MKVISFYRAQSDSVRTGDILVTQDRTLVLQEDSTKCPSLEICTKCAIDGDLCSKGGLLCGERGYFVDIEPTEEIEHARDLFALKGELM